MKHSRNISQLLLPKIWLSDLRVTLDRNDVVCLTQTLHILQLIKTAAHFYRIDLFFLNYFALLPTRTA